jgi:hypothetical protein
MLALRHRVYETIILFFLLLSNLIIVRIRLDKLLRIKDGLSTRGIVMLRLAPGYKHEGFLNGDEKEYTRRNSIVY